MAKIFQGLVKMAQSLMGKGDIVVPFGELGVVADRLLALFDCFL